VTEKCNYPILEKKKKKKKKKKKEEERKKERENTLSLPQLFYLHHQIKLQKWHLNTSNYHLMSTRPLR
jgi:hypothetical protein